MYSLGSNNIKCVHTRVNKEGELWKRGLKGGIHLRWASCPGRVAERTREDCKLGGVRTKSNVNAYVEKEPWDPFHCMLAKEGIESSACSLLGPIAPKFSHKPAPKACGFHGHVCHSHGSTPWYPSSASICLQSTVTKYPTDTTQTQLIFGSWIQRLGSLRWGEGAAWSISICSSRKTQWRLHHTRRQVRTQIGCSRSKPSNHLLPQVRCDISKVP